MKCEIFIKLLINFSMRHCEKCEPDNRGKCHGIPQSPDHGML